MSSRLRATGHIDLIPVTARTPVTDQVAAVDTAMADHRHTRRRPLLTIHPPARSIRPRPARL